MAVECQRGNDAANRRVFRCRQKDASDDVDRTLSGNEFQARAAATGNARSPRVDRRVDGTSVDVLADLSRRRASTSVDKWSVSERYDGNDVLAETRGSNSSIREADWQMTASLTSATTGCQSLPLPKVTTCEVSRPRTSLGNRSFTVAGLHLCNNLPLYLRDSELTLLEFHQLLKKHRRPWHLVTDTLSMYLLIYLITSRSGCRKKYWTLVPIQSYIIRHQYSSSYSSSNSNNRKYIVTHNKRTPIHWDNSIQVAQLSQRDRTAGWVSYRQKWKTGTGRQYLWTL